jgi:hypothetical protein
MANTMISRLLLRIVFMICIFIMANPHGLFAQDSRHDFKGFYSKKLKSKIDKTKSKIRSNLKKYMKDKSTAYLDESYILLINSTDEIYTSLETASQQVQETPMDNKSEKIQAQIDKLEIITIRDTESPYLCNQLYEVGKLYIGADKKKAKQCFRDIVTRFTSYESKNCNKKAEIALENLK